MKVSPIAEPRQIRALASSTRQDIVDTIAAIGPCSVAELARALGRSADGLYYHIRVLTRVGLLVAREVISRSGNTRRLTGFSKGFSG